MLDDYIQSSMNNIYESHNRLLLRAKSEKGIKVVLDDACKLLKASRIQRACFEMTQIDEEKEIAAYVQGLSFLENAFSSPEAETHKKTLKIITNDPIRVNFVYDNLLAKLSGLLNPAIEAHSNLVSLELNDVYLLQLALDSSRTNKLIDTINDVLNKTVNLSLLTREVLGNLKTVLSDPNKSIDKDMLNQNEAISLGLSQLEQLVVNSANIGIEPLKNLFSKAKVINWVLLNKQDSLSALDLNRIARVREGLIALCREGNIKSNLLTHLIGFLQPSYIEDNLIDSAFEKFMGFKEANDLMQTYIDLSTPTVIISQIFDLALLREFAEADALIIYKPFIKALQLQLSRLLNCLPASAIYRDSLRETLSGLSEFISVVGSENHKKLIVLMDKLDQFDAIFKEQSSFHNMHSLFLQINDLFDVLSPDVASETCLDSMDHLKDDFNKKLDSMISEISDKKIVEAKKILLKQFPNLRLTVKNGIADYLRVLLDFTNTHLRMNNSNNAAMEAIAFLYKQAQIGACCDLLSSDQLLDINARLDVFFSTVFMRLNLIADYWDQKLLLK